MTHFVCFPSADPKRGIKCAETWIKAGYKALVMFDADKVVQFDFDTRLLEKLFTSFTPSPFPGYYKVINSIVARAFDLGATCISAIGDDMEPPTQGAEEIASMYFKRFPDGYGVLQATGDRQGEVINGKVNSERICGSPTFGRGWYERGYKEVGGFCSEYASFYGDEDLQNVALKKGVLWQEPLIKIDHVHWAFGRAHKQDYHDRASLNWTKDQQTFMARKAAGFPE